MGDSLNPITPEIAMLAKEIAAGVNALAGGKFQIAENSAANHITKLQKQGINIPEELKQLDTLSKNGAPPEKIYAVSDGRKLQGLVVDQGIITLIHTYDQALSFKLKTKGEVPVIQIGNAGSGRDIPFFGGSIIMHSHGKPVKMDLSEKTDKERVSISLAEGDGTIVMGRDTASANISISTFEHHTSAQLEMHAALTANTETTNVKSSGKNNIPIQGTNIYLRNGNEIELQPSFERSEAFNVKTNITDYTKRGEKIAAPFDLYINGKPASKISESLDSIGADIIQRAADKSRLQQQSERLR